MKYALFILTSLILLCPQKSSAEAIPTYEIDTITVTANRSVSSGDDTGTFEVISHEMISKGNYKNVSEVLQTIPGVYFATESFLGNRSTESNTGPKIRIRGKGAKLLIDGRPMNMPIYGCLTNNMLTLDHVERIEVNRGSESVLYGSDGLGGVINIITRKPGELGAGLMVRGGENNTIISSLEHENTIGSFGYFISGSLKRSDGYRGNSDFKDENGFLKLSYEINPSLNLDTSFNIYNGNWNDPGTVLNPQLDFWADYKRRHTDITLSGKSETATYSFKVFHNEGHHIFTEQDGWQSRDNTNGYRTEMVKNFSGGINRLIVGSDGHWLAGKALVDDDIYNNFGFKFWLNNREWFRENEVALFASDRQILMDGLFSLVGGARIVHNSGFGNFFCPKLGVSINRENSRIHFGYNRAFKSPSLLQTNLHKKSNPDLNPETANHFEVGGDYKITELLTVRGAVFYIDGDDQVGMKYIGGNPQGFENIGSWKHKGSELSMSWMPYPVFSLNAGYTYMDVGSNTQYNPKHQANLNVRTGWTLLGRELSLNLNGLGISSIYASNDSRDRLNDYMVFDLYADWRIHKYGSIIIGVNNLMDEKYESVRGYPLPGRVFTAGIRL